jgi:hypothetical protein
MVLIAIVVAGAVCVLAQELPPPDDSRHSMLREAMRGLLSAQAGVPATWAVQHCLKLPVDPPNDRLQGPHGDSLVSERCQVTEYRPLGDGSLARWTTARYEWTSLFTAEDTTRGESARDTVIEEEVVLFDARKHGQVRAVWHARFETGASAVWRSVTPELASTSQGATLLSVMSCLNGTGGCGQEFLERYPDGQWAAVWQVWLDQLPHGFADRIRHGVRIDPSTLRGEAGFYSEGDANCCPSQRLVVQLALHGDALVLGKQAVVEEQAQ